jgi:hypothetical protein
VDPVLDPFSLPSVAFPEKTILNNQGELKVSLPTVATTSTFQNLDGEAQLLVCPIN